MLGLKSIDVPPRRVEREKERDRGAGERRERKEKNVRCIKFKWLMYGRLADPQGFSLRVNRRKKRESGFARNYTEPSRTFQRKMKKTRRFYRRILLIPNIFLFLSNASTFELVTVASDRPIGSINLIPARGNIFLSSLRFVVYPIFHPAVPPTKSLPFESNPTVIRDRIIDSIESCFLFH